MEPREERRSRGRSRSAALVCAGVLALLGAAPQVHAGAEPELAKIADWVDAGRFEAAEAEIARALRRPGLSAAHRSALAFERERMRRILLEFTLDEARARARLREQVPDLRDEEFVAWDRQGLLEHLVIDGRKRYFNRAVGNLFRLSPEALARRKPGLPPLSQGPMEAPHPHHSEVREQALATGRSSVAPRRLRVTHSLTVRAGAVPPGETLRAWLPYPREIPGQQEDIRLVGGRPGKPRIAPASALQRTAYLEQRARAAVPTTFSVTYELTVYGQYHVIEPERVVPAPRTPEVQAHLGERPPHIVFTDAMREFSRAVVGEETHPYRIARKLYAAVDRIPWAGAREYSTLSNLSDYALRAGHADCGQQTLLLMTLLRLNGIPARWQSGVVYSDGDYWNLHDWARIYLAPYGWVPVDVTTGRFADGGPQLEDFYFGGLDAYRIAFNDDYGRAFVPPKQHFRSDTVDLQRGEVEWRGGNLYFDQWEYDFEWRVLPAP